MSNLDFIRHELVAREMFCPFKMCKTYNEDRRCDAEICMAWLVASVNKEDRLGYCKLIQK